MPMSWERSLATHPNPFSKFNTISCLAGRIRILWPIILSREGMYTYKAASLFGRQKCRCSILPVVLSLGGLGQPG